MRKRSTFLLLITVLLGIYYLVLGIYFNKLGYYNAEALFYIEKSKIVFEGLGNRLKVMGLTSPIIPFYATFLFTSLNYLLAPVIASAIGTAIFFYIITATLLKDVKDNFYLALLLVLFLFHPGILYTATAGKSIYLVLTFFYLFFLNILKFYRSNTTYHVSIASMCLVTLTFCDYRFIWLTLFFIPLVLSITLKSLNLSEKESIFRLFISFNNPSLRRKLISKTFALYIIIFILPIASIVCYKLLNLTHANDLNYFIESPYATWNVLVDKINFDEVTNINTYKMPDSAVLLSLKMIMYAPLILLALYMYRQNTYQALTLLTPFAFIEFLRLKYDNIYIAHEFYIIFIILALLCIIFRLESFRNKKTLRILMGVGMAIQIFTGYYFLNRSSISDEQKFMAMLRKPIDNHDYDESKDIANYINALPDNALVMTDDAVAYPIAAFVDNIQKLVMPYQDKFLTAIEAPRGYVSYILVASPSNRSKGYTQLNNTYFNFMRSNDSGMLVQKVYETPDWELYRIK
ncbi:hypothetical protein IM792_20795 [Mucilaginibacter sp. JRF]|uniref:hypothetical protein n=1 Tax=Mucilaginibacter sp. JRF TaxID=2780088 RepID=UPI00187F0BA4|nr:hypothetical protein [Mucilaginibacter sp. JRF]MBE9586900.1 hypothetical protein [Mucilaginibacter sp. JRF]